MAPRHQIIQTVGWLPTGLGKHQARERCELVESHKHNDAETVDGLTELGYLAGVSIKTSDLGWSEQTADGWEHVRGEAFGYPVLIEVYPCGDRFRWRATLLNQVVVGTGETREDARSTALQSAGRGLLRQAVGNDQ
jgi:hypothetical protein